MVPNRHPARRALRVPEGGLEDGGAACLERFELTEAHPKDQPLSAVRVPAGPPSISPGPLWTSVRLDRLRGAEARRRRSAAAGAERLATVHLNPKASSTTLHLAPAVASSSSRRGRKYLFFATGSQTPFQDEPTCPRRRFLNTTNPAPRPWTRRLATPRLSPHPTLFINSFAAGDGLRHPPPSKYVRANCERGAEARRRPSAAAGAERLATANLNPRPARRPSTWPRRWLHPVAEGGGSTSSLRPIARPHSKTSPRAPEGGS